MSAAPKLKTDELTVSALAARLKGLVESHYPTVWVAGEVSNFTRAASGHWYFTLKDAGAQIRAAMFRGFNLRIKFDPKDGMEVLARGRVTVYESRGEMQLIVEELQPKGIGAAELALRQLKEKLLARGYFDPQRKRRLPRFPASRRPGCQRQRRGDSRHDRTLRPALAARLNSSFARAACRATARPRKSPRPCNCSIRFTHAASCRSTPSCSAAAAAAPKTCGRSTRKSSRRAIFESVVPVVSAVGHEIDVTIADLVADHRAETPSAAVVALTPDRPRTDGGSTATTARDSSRRSNTGSNSLGNASGSARGPAGTSPAASANPRSRTTAR